MRFSEAFAINRTIADDWFDPHLSIDTRLFVDPLLLLESSGAWSAAHQELIDHFVHCYRLVAKSTSPRSVSGLAARRLLAFPEPREVGLGYSKGSTRGAGSGGVFAQRIADGIAVAISAGLTHPEHIEEIGILNEGIGADRISDAVINVLKSRFVAYTQAVARRHNVPLDEHRIRNARCNLRVGRWVDEKTLLPTNPVTGGAVILVPEHLLNQLPVLNADDWFDSHLNADIRAQLNIEVGTQVSKHAIVRFAREHPERVRQWAREQTSRPDLSGYDYEGDPLGVVQWDREPLLFAQTHPVPITRVTTQAELSTLVAKMVDQFRHFIEEQRGWALLWNDDGSEKPESAAQLVFLGMAQHYLRLFDVEVDREVELGRGPVDFKASSGSTTKLLIEIKKAHNGKFWNGLDTQLLSYLSSDDCQEGWFVALRYRDNRASAQRMRDLPPRVRAAALGSGKTLHYAAVDTRRPKSASKIEPPSPH